MQASKIKKSLAVAMSASFAATVSATPMTMNTDSNPFGMHNLSSGYMQVADKSAGEGNCGGNKKVAEASCGGKANKPAEGNDGSNNNTTTKKGNNMPEGKCGEGKCGAGMMKTDNSSDAGTGK